MATIVVSNQNTQGVQFTGLDAFFHGKFLRSTDKEWITPMIQSGQEFTQMYSVFQHIRSLVGPQPTPPEVHPFGRDFVCYQGDCPLRFIQTVLTHPASFGIVGYNEAYLGWGIKDEYIRANWRYPQRGPVRRSHVLRALSLLCDVTVAFGMCLATAASGADVRFPKENRGLLFDLQRRCRNLYLSESLVDLTTVDLTTDCVDKGRVMDEDLAGEVHEFMTGVAAKAYEETRPLCTLHTVDRMIAQHRAGTITQSDLVNFLNRVVIPPGADLSNLRLHGWNQAAGHGDHLPIKWPLRANITGTTLTNCALLLSNPDFQRVHAVNSVFTADVISSPIVDCVFERCKFAGTIFRAVTARSRFIDCTFDRCSLVGLNTRATHGALMGNTFESCLYPPAAQLDPASATYLRLLGHPIDDTEDQW